VDTNVNVPFQGKDRPESIRLAESGHLRAHILRNITQLTILSNIARARLFTDSAKPPFGLVCGTGEQITLKLNASGRWHASEAKTIVNDDYAIPGDSNALKIFTFPLPK
jgi:hypothetical protein